MLVVLLAMAVPFAALLVYSTVKLTQQEIRKSREQSLQIAELTGAHVQQFIDDMHSVLRHIAERPLIRAMDPGRRDPLFDDFLALYPQFGNLIVADADGRIVHSAQPSPGVPVFATDLNWFVTVRDTNRFSIGTPHYGRIIHKWVSTLAYPIQDDRGRFIGTVGLPVDLERFEVPFASIRFPSEATIVIIDATGTVVAHSKDPGSWVGKNMHDVEIVRVTLGGAQGTTEAAGIDGIVRIYGFTHIPDADWYVYAGLPERQALAAINNNASINALAALVIFSLVALLTGYLAQRINRPVQALARATGAIALGDTDARMPLDGPREIAAVAAGFNDILTSRAEAQTALENSQAKLQLALHASNTGLWDWDIEHGEMYFSPEWKAQIGYNDNELQDSFREWESRLHPDDHDRVLFNLQAFLDDSDRSEYEAEFRLRHREGGYRWILARAQLQRDAAGRPLRMSGCHVDITDRIEAEARIRQLNAELEQRVIERTAELDAANQGLESFSYSVAHDLRSPLRSIDGFSRILQEEYDDLLDDEGKSLVRRICSASKRMGRLIDDLLDLARVTHAPLNRRSVNMSAMAEQIIMELRGGAPDRRVTVRIPPDIHVEADPNLLRIALINLLGNAWKFTAQTNDPAIELGMSQALGSRTYFVRDNGAGFDMSYVDKLFGAFQRLHSDDEYEGTGIGLATVQRIINRHGGLVWAEGEVGKGATIYFTLSAATNNAAVDSNTG